MSNQGLTTETNWEGSIVTNFGDKVSFIWSVADLLRGPYKPAQYKDVMLPLTVLRRLDCVLEPTKEKVLAKAAELKGGKVANAEPILNRVAKASFHNTSKLDFAKLQGRAGQDRRQPDRLHQGVLFPGPRHLREIQVRGGDRHARRKQPPVLGREEVCRNRPAPDPCLQHRDGLHLRGTDPAIQRSGERDSGRPLHAPRSHPADGQPAVRPRPRPAHARRASSARCSIRPAEPAACWPSPTSTCTN